MKENQLTVNLCCGNNNLHFEIECPEDVTLAIETIERFYQKTKKRKTLKINPSKPLPNLMGDSSID